jgi:hypothetical protein
MKGYRPILPKLTLDTSPTTLQGCTTAILEHQVPAYLPVHPHVDLLPPSRKLCKETPQEELNKTPYQTHHRDRVMTDELERERSAHEQTRQSLLQSTDSIAWLQQERANLIATHEAWVKAWSNVSNNLTRCDAERRWFQHGQSRLKQQVKIHRTQVENL